jgi:hypothetical protein
MNMDCRRSAMYGNVLSGGLGGHIYGASGWQGGIWSGEVEEAGVEIPDVERIRMALGRSDAAFENIYAIPRTPLSRFNSFNSGRIALPPYPGDAAKSDTDWALKLVQMKNE